MSLTVQQLLSDAKRLTGRLRDHDSATDGIISAAQDVLKEVEAMRQYQEDIESLNTIAHNRPRAQLVLGIQQENRHIRQLQHENKELRAALEEHQNVLELIMSKYREHMSCFQNSTKIEQDLVTRENTKVLQDRADKICEMANVMQKSIQIDEENMAKEQELMARLATENKGLREMLEISHRNGSYSNPLVGPRLVSTSCQTEELISEKKSSQDKNSSPNSNKIMPSKQNPENSGNCSELGGSCLSPNSKNSSQQCSNSNSTSPLRACDGGGGDSPGNSAENAKDSYLVMNGIQIEDAISSPQRPLSSASEESESSISEDDEISFNTIKRGTGSKLQAAMKNNQIRLADFCQGSQTSSKLSLNTIITNSEKQQQNPFCDQEMKNSTCSVVGSSAVTNCENEQQQQTNVNSQASSMKSDGDNSGVVVDSSLTTVPQINGGPGIHIGNDKDSTNSEDQTVRTTNAANEDNNNGHTALHQNQSDEDTNDRTSGTTITSTSGAVEDNVIFQAKSKQQVVLETETAAIIQEQTSSSMS